MFSQEEKIKLMKSLMWDYNIPPEHCLEVLEGSREMAGHYNEDTLFRKLLESFPWFTILELLPLSRIFFLLKEKTVHSLRSKSLTLKYEFVRTRLQKIVSAAG